MIGDINASSQNQSNFLHISNLPFDTTEEDLVAFLKDYHIKSVKIIKKNSKLFAHAEFETADFAEQARNELNCVNFIPRLSQSGIMKTLSFSRIEQIDKDQMKNEVGKNVLVKNLPADITGREFYSMMREFGDIKHIKFNCNIYGKSQGSGHVYYYDTTSAEAAIEKLNGNKMYTKPLIVCKLIPGKTKDNYKNNLYVKNFPKDFTEDDLKKYFLKFGELKSVVIQRDEEGNSKGFGFVCFLNPGNANQAVRELKDQPHQFPGCDTLYAAYAMKKDERVEMMIKDSGKLEKTTIFGKLREDLYLIKTAKDLEKEIRSMINLIFGYEYTPKEIKIKMETKSALITMISPNHVEQFMQNYLSYSQYYLPRVFFNYYQSKAERSATQEYINQLNSFMNPYSMFSHFANLAVVDPTKKPVIFVDPSYNELNRNAGKPRGFNYTTRLQQRADQGKQNRGQYQYKYQPQQPQPQYQQKTLTDESLYLVQPQTKPVSNKEETNNADEHEEICASIYENVNKKFPNDAGKITGMIIDLGFNEMKRLLAKPDQLEKIIEEANQMITKKKE